MNPVSWFEGLNPKMKIIIGGGAAIGGYLLYRNFKSSSANQLISPQTPYPVDSGVSSDSGSNGGVSGGDNVPSSFGSYGSRQDGFNSGGSGDWSVGGGNGSQSDGSQGSVTPHDPTTGSTAGSSQTGNSLGTGRTGQDSSHTGSAAGSNPVNNTPPPPVTPVTPTPSQVRTVEASVPIFHPTANNVVSASSVQRVAAATEQSARIQTLAGDHNVVTPSIALMGTVHDVGAPTLHGSSDGVWVDHKHYSSWQDYHNSQPKTPVTRNGARAV